jgi:hypothetical protein
MARNKMAIAAQQGGTRRPGLLRALGINVVAKAVVHAGLTLGLPVIGVLLAATGFAAVKHVGPFAPKAPSGPSQTVVLDALVSHIDYRADQAEFTADFVVHHGPGGIAGIFVGNDIVVHAVGTVNVFDNFATLAKSAVSVTGFTASITLPPPYLESASIDPARTGATPSGGVFTRIGGLFSNSDDERQAYEEARQKIDAKAAQTPSLISDAEASTRDFLSGFLRKIGILRVTVTFQ